MKENNQRDELNHAIGLLQFRQSGELEILKEQFKLAYESLQPINLIKSTWKEVVESPDLKDNMVDQAIGLTTGYLLKKVFMGVSHNPARKVMGALLQFAVANFVSKHSDTIKLKGEKVLQHIFKSNHKN